MRQDLLVLRHRPFLFLFLARTVSLFGNAIAPVALAFAVLGLPGGSATDLGLILGARAVAQIAFLLFGGVLADRLPRHRLMVGADVAAGLAQGGAALLFVGHIASLGPLMALSALNGAASALFLPASQGLLPQVIPAGRLQPANALLRMSMNAANLGGATVSAVLVATIGPGWSLAADAATFLVSAALLAGVRVQERATPGWKTTVIGDLRSGWREFASRQWLWVIVVQFSVGIACYSGAVQVLGPAVGKDHLGGAPVWAAILTANSAGLVAGSLLAIRLRPRYPMRAATYATFGFAAPPLLLAVSAAPAWLVGASMFVNGLCTTVFGVLWDTGLQTHVPREALSRVSSYDALGSFCLGPVGIVVAGPLAEAVGTSTALVVFGVTLAASSAVTVMVPSVRHLRAAPSEADVPVPS
ncbi:MFS transporter [Sphaerisporangium fuscum]|uniref:MFS transporter n=1 Tax=Sphaerisporangium fuscum TaxID=2835868 RepID=UPI001BDBD8AD|nr:MFS transporter [Sphaerisporangium fuscum]